MRLIKDDVFKNGYMNSAMRDRYDNPDLESKIKYAKTLLGKFEDYK